MDNGQIIEQIKQRISIVDLIGRFVHLKQIGGRYTAPCPFHAETKPSFSVNPNNGFFYCFGCHKSGDIFNFWMEYHGVNFREALEQLASEAGVSLEHYSSSAKKHSQEERTKRQQILFMYKLAQIHFQENLRSEAGAACREYMKERGISEEIMGRFGLGWALDEWTDLSSYLKQQGCSQELAMEGGLIGKSSKTGMPFDPFRARLMFPIRNTSGETIAFGGRIIDNTQDAAKYVNTKDSPVYKKGEHLYGLDLASRSIRENKNAFLTEGYMDVLTLHQFGYTNSIGGLGTALTDQQVQRIIGFTSTVTLLYDADNAGRKAALEATKKFLSRGARVLVILQPQGEDIDSLLRTQGKESFEKLNNMALTGERFCCNVLQDMATIDALKWLKEFIQGVQIPEQVSYFLHFFASRLGIDEVELRAGAKKNISEHRQFLPEKESAPDTDTEEMKVHEREILRCAVRYPERLRDIRACGADLLLNSAFAVGLWKKLEETPLEELGYSLEGKELQFWNWCRGMESPPRTVPDIELSAVKMLVQNIQEEAQKRSIISVIRKNDEQHDFGGVRFFKTLREIGHS